jgi:hypothetical protein
MSASLSTDEVLKKIETFCDKFTTFKEAALALKVTPSQLSLTMSGKTNVIPEKILRKLGLQSIVAYVPIGKTATKKIKVSRDSATGRTVSKAAAKADPQGTTIETVERAVKPPVERRATPRPPKKAKPIAAVEVQVERVVRNPEALATPVATLSIKD